MIATLLFSLYRGLYYAPLREGEEGCNCNNQYEICVCENCFMAIRKVTDSDG